MKCVCRQLETLCHFSIVLALLTAAVPVVRAQAPNNYTLFLATASPAGQVMSDPETLSGRYVSQNSAWQPMIFCPLPTSGESWVIWARLKDINVQLKSVAADGQQTPLNWEWQQPDDWTWVSLGRHTRSELQSKILLMRGSNAGSSPGLDAVVYADDDAFDPDASIKVPSSNFQPVAVDVDWNRPLARATRDSYGLNAFGGFDPVNTQNPVYEKNMASMDAGLLRLHNWGMLDDSSTSPTGWIDTANKRWDENKIKAALVGAYGYGPDLLINIPSWPSWMDNNGMLNTDRVDDFAKFCADLVRIVNIDLKVRAKYWEVTNERDGPYYGDFHDNGGALKDPTKPDHVADLVNIYNSCAVAMKAVDPTIKIGGPAEARPDWNDFTSRFAQGTVNNLDFFSFHAYASGSKDDSDKYIFDRAQGFGGDVAGINGILQNVSPNRPIPIIFDEYNISWTWQTRDPRMAGVQGAVFDALAIVSAMDHGASATAAWNDKDGVYGKMDDSYQLRPSAALFRSFNRHMVGSVVAATASDPGAIVPYAVLNRDGSKFVMLINRSRYSRLAQEDGVLKGARVVDVISSSADPVFQHAVGTIPLAAESITVLSLQSE